MKTYILSISKSERIQTSIDFWDKWGWEHQRFNNDGKFPSWGRNEIFDDFYNSSDEWCCVADDDCVLFEDRNETEYFLENTLEVLNKLPPMVSVLWPLNGVLTPVNQVQQHHAVKNNWYFERHWNGGKLIFLRNGMGKFYQDTSLDYYEDIDFMYQHIKHGNWTGSCANLVVRERGASQLFESQEDRTKDIRATDQLMMDRYPEFYIKGGKVHRDRFMRKYAVPPKKITIPFDHKANHFNSLFDS